MQITKGCPPSCLKRNAQFIPRHAKELDVQNWVSQKYDYSTGPCIQCNNTISTALPVSVAILVPRPRRAP